MSIIKDSYHQIKTNVKRLETDKTPTLVAVSKTYPPESIIEVYEEGQLDFGENRVQELVEKYEQLPKDIRWHLIGHLQTNKVKYIAPFVHLIHAVDSIKLLKEINKQGEKNNRTISCLLQFHIAEEESKFGLSLNEARELLESEFYAQASFIKICGVMGMATFTEDMKQVEKEFKHLSELFQTLKQDYFSDKPDFKEISMGMSNDYPVAISCGSTLVRVGSSIFGKRE